MSVSSTDLPSATPETVSLTVAQKALLTAYSALWAVARPVLGRNKRLKQGLSQRVVPEFWALSCDVWMQAASGGEAYLAWEMLKAIPKDRECRFLLTSWTRQGVDVLNEAREWCRKNRPNLLVNVTYFPFDQPCKMRRAMKMASPSLVVLLETEIWPGIMLAAKEQRVPVAIINGRMTPASLAGLLTIRGLLRALAPERVYAMSDADASRFASLFQGKTRVSSPREGMVSRCCQPETLFEDVPVERMNNIKFDRVSGTAGKKKNPLLGKVIRSGISLLALGSVREEEEAELIPLVKKLRTARPKTSIAIIPRHMHRVSAWQELLQSAGIDYALRSQVKKDAPAAGSVILWDVFGELTAVYELSRAVFIGGSLVRLGGQNFLEPLSYGVSPVIGPHYSNFSWAEGLIEEGLVYKGADSEEVYELLLKHLKRPAVKETVIKRYSAWLKPLQGGAGQAVEAVWNYLK